MAIISHKYKFMFFKAKKVAGTSIEVNLAKHCGPKDIVAKIGPYKPKKDETSYNHKPRNYNGFINHMPPIEIKQKFLKTWDDYFKFTVVRNPWDLQVSCYWWQRRWLPDNPTFNKHIKRTHLDNYKYYFWKDGTPTCDFYIRYEHLEEDYKKVCEKLGIPYEPLPRTKNLVRQNKKPYQEYYNEKTKARVFGLNKHMITHFGYEF